MRGWFWTGRAISLHIAVVITVPGCLALGWWQFHRALSGNGLSWAYTFEWPFFALYGLVMWWRLVNDQRSDAPAPRRLFRSARRLEKDAARAESERVELAAYNAYLAELQKEDREPTARQPSTRKDQPPEREAIS